MFVLLGVLVIFPVMYVSWIPESPSIWERAAYPVYHLSHLFLTSLHVVTSFAWYIVGGVWDLIVSVPDLALFNIYCQNIAQPVNVRRYGETFMECSINSPALSLLMKHLVIGQR